MDIDDSAETPRAPTWESNFIEHVVRLREARGMTQTDLARALAGHGLKFHQQTIQRIEAGERPVRLDEAHLIAKVLDVSLDSMTSRAAASNDMLIFDVTRLRRQANELAHELREILNDWADKVDSFVAGVDDLNPEAGEQSPLVRWALEWCTRFNEITAKLHDATDEAAWTGGQTELERQMSIFSLEVVNAWIEGRVWKSSDELSIGPDQLSAWIREHRG